MTHPDVLWELVQERRQRLLDEAEQQRRVHRIAGAHGSTATAARGRRAFRWIGTGLRRRSAGTLAPCAPGVAD